MRKSRKCGGGKCSSNYCTPKTQEELVDQIYKDYNGHVLSQMAKGFPLEDPFNPSVPQMVSFVQEHCGANNGDKICLRLGHKRFLFSEIANLVKEKLTKNNTKSGGRRRKTRRVR